MCHKRLIVLTLAVAALAVAPTLAVAQNTSARPAAITTTHAAGVLAVVAGETVPFFATGVAALVGARDIFLALSSVTMMSPCCSAAALSSMDFKASDQVWPTALQAQDGLNS